MERGEKVFKEFIDLCREVTSDDTVVLELLQKRYNGTNLHFLWSDDFPDLVDRCSQRILTDRDNKYVYIKEFTTELKAYKAKPLKHLRDAQHDGGSTRKRDSSSENGRASSKRLKLESSAREENASNRVRSPILGHVTNLSCSLIPLSMISSMVMESPKSSSVEAGGSGSKTGEAEAKLKSFVVKVDDVKKLKLPELQVELEQCKIPFDSELLESSSSDRISLINSLSDPEQPLPELHPDDPVAPGVGQEEGRNEVQESRLQRNIRKLEKLLKKISDEIKKLQEAELTLEDMNEDDSSYTLEDRYKKRFVKVWNRLCQLKGRQTTTGRETDYD